MKSLEKLIDEFNSLPGIGRKSAIRLAFYVLDLSQEEIEKFVFSIKDAKDKIKKCSNCGNLTEDDLCSICSDETRDKKIICVVESTRDIIAFEKSGTYNGEYHVLGGKIDPLNGVTIEDLNIKKLLERVEKNNVEEIIFGLNPDLEGETTSMYVSRLFEDKDVIITRIASGISVGGNIEYADMATLAKSLEGRKKI